MTHHLNCDICSKFLVQFRPSQVTVVHIFDKMNMRQKENEEVNNVENNTIYKNGYNNEGSDSNQSNDLNMNPIHEYIKDNVYQLFLRSKTAYSRYCFHEDYLIVPGLTCLILSEPYLLGDLSVKNKESLLLSKLFGYGFISRLRSDDIKRAVGCVITNTKYQILGLGWNAYPRKTEEGDFPIGQGKQPYVIHAEQNTLLFCNTNLEPNETYNLLSTRIPCLECGPLILEISIDIPCTINLYFTAYPKKDEYTQSEKHLIEGNVNVIPFYCRDPFDYTCKEYLDRIDQ